MRDTAGNGLYPFRRSLSWVSGALLERKPFVIGSGAGSGDYEWRWVVWQNKN